ncbi:MAG: hypothetical protein WD063_11010 [Pirellulales bacterium]
MARAFGAFQAVEFALTVVVPVCKGLKAMEVIFEFSGGSRDGQTDVGIAAQRHYFVTDKGTIGKRFWVATEHALNLLKEIGPDAARESGNARAEKYEVTERLDVGDEALVRCKFIEYADQVVIPESQPAAESNPPAAPAAREQRRMQCRFCNGTGRITAYQDRRTTRNIVCEICNGHGDYLTDLWSQPDCAYCGGTARVVTERTLYRITEARCGICGGTGKRPFDS